MSSVVVSVVTVASVRIGELGPEEWSVEVCGTDLRFPVPGTGVSGSATVVARCLCCGVSVPVVPVLSSRTVRGPAGHLTSDELCLVCGATSEVG